MICQVEEHLRGFFSQWYKCHGRSYPWRDDNVSAYGILIAELMLRKTQAEKVVNQWVEFMSRFPSPSDSLKSQDSQLNDLLLPLGLSKIRVKAIKEICKIIDEKHGGELPQSTDILLMLPHVGIYTASAIACFAFNKRVAIVDGNVIRIISRIFGEISKEDNRRVPEVWKTAEAILPLTSYKEHNYGLLDFAGLICKARLPKCGLCPLAGICSQNLNTIEQINNQTTEEGQQAIRKFQRKIL